MFKELFWGYNKKEKNLKFIKTEKEEILKTMCILDSKFLLIGKSNGFLSIYNIEDNKEIQNKKIHEKSITFLMPYEKQLSNFFSCSEDSIINWVELKDGIYGRYELEIIMNIKIHQSCVKKLEYLKNNDFASCSMDNSFIIWHLDETKRKITELMKINDSTGIENFFLNMKKNSNNSFKNLIILNIKNILSFYINKNEKPFLKNLIIGVDYTNNNSMAKINDKLFIGGFKYLQIISIQKMQYETKIKCEDPISCIYNLGNNFLALGFKNGTLKFLDKKLMKILNLEDDKDCSKIKKMEEQNNQQNSIIDNGKKFKFLSLINNNELKLYEDGAILLLKLYNGMLFCISDETIKIYKNEIEKEIKKDILSLDSVKTLVKCFDYFIQNRENYSYYC